MCLHLVQRQGLGQEEIVSRCQQDAQYPSLTGARLRDSALQSFQAASPGPLFASSALAEVVWAKNLSFAQSRIRHACDGMELRSSKHRQIRTCRFEEHGLCVIQETQVKVEMAGTWTTSKEHGIRNCARLAWISLLNEISNTRWCVVYVFNLW